MVGRLEAVRGPREGLVAIAAADVNFVDIGVRPGGAWTEIRNPKVLGVVSAGRVLVGGDGVLQGAWPSITRTRRIAALPIV